MRSLSKRFTRIREEERGAEAVEFALISPLLFFLVFGLIYLLLAFAAQLSLGYATNVAVRYAAIPLPGTTSTYPTSGQVLTKATSVTPFFGSSACSPTLGSGGINQPVTLTLSCDFPNPAGHAVNGFRSVFFGGGGDDVQTTIEMSATAQSRKE
ncbi:MAG TPA: TadE/TadG family type IV pilus assembly protein [Actinomycetota bacterium]|nr:TadE/TadG family type IV pilus assembly protein [Actinomycetota bacterium]